MPTAVAFGTDRKIYKRVSAKQYPDKQYNEVVAELESQGFGERKRARKDTYARPYPGHVDFEPKDEMINTGTQDLALARGKSPHPKQYVDGRSLIPWCRGS